MEMFDCIIIGAGPAGLSAGINLVQRGKKCVALSGGDNLLRKAEKVENYLGMPTMSGSEMMDSFVKHAIKQGVEIRNGIAANVYPSGNEFLVNFAGDIISAKTVIITSGIAKAKQIKGEGEYLGRGVSYCATCDGMLYKGKAIAVWGLDADAPREANYLLDIGCTVSYIAAVRPDNLAADIRYIAGAPSEVIGGDIVNGVKVNDTIYPINGLFILRSSIAPSALLPGIEIEEGFIKVNNKAATNIKGVYAAGDVVGKPLQVANAVGDGLVAALSAAEYIDKL
ncbi:MAG: FAD-dependent oxidoreductase [Oscillospiraceae bacterium]